MDFGRLHELNDLFKRYDDATALVCLSQGVNANQGRPLRLRELARAIVVQSGEFVAENSLRRALPRLRAEQLVTIDDAETQHPMYSPTPLGEQRAARIAAIINALDGRPGGDDDHR